MFDRIISSYNSTDNQRGNVLFLILIAVALFAALSYAVTSSSRSGSSDASKDDAVLKASEIIQYGTALRSAAMRLKLSNDCSDDQISMETPSGLFINANAPTDKHCHVFHPSGGGQTYINNPFPNVSLTNEPWDFTFRRSIKNIGINCGSNPCSELVTNVGITKSVCLSINSKLGISTSTGDIPLSIVILLPHSGGLGDSTWDGNQFPGGAGDTALIGQMNGCYRAQMNPDGTCTGGHCGYYYYHVLIAR